jgi:hypothetical protein
MGYGMFLQMSNNASKPVTTTVIDVKCVYDGGAEGSNPSVFNGVSIGPGGIFPHPAAYVEQKGSGLCFFQGINAFTIVVNADGRMVDIIRFTAGGARWTVTNNPMVSTVSNDTSGDQGRINISIFHIA